MVWSNACFPLAARESGTLRDCLYLAGTKLTRPGTWYSNSPLGYHLYAGLPCLYSSDPCCLPRDVWEWLECGSTSRPLYLYLSYSYIHIISYRTSFILLCALHSSCSQPTEAEGSPAFCGVRSGGRRRNLAYEPKSIWI